MRILKKKMQSLRRYCMSQKLKKKSFILLIIIIGIIALILWTLWGNTAIMIHEIIIDSDRISDTFDGFRIVHISDLHNAEFGADNERLLTMLTESEPDIIVITGDLIDSNHTDIQVALDFIFNIVELAPCYYVTGNHEGWFDNYNELETGLLDAGVIVLHDEEAIIEKDGELISIVGIDDPDFANIHGGITKNSIISNEIAKLSTYDGFSILLSHRPELFSQYCEAGFDLVFSGHAHGGQIRLPFIGGLIAPNQGFFPAYDSGVYSDENTSMIVSRGLGNSIIPLRFNNRPEIVLVELNAID